MRFVFVFRYVVCRTESRGSSFRAKAYQHLNILDSTPFILRHNYVLFLNKDHHL